jgi:hypothetical protein
MLIHISKKKKLKTCIYQPKKIQEDRSLNVATYLFVGKLDNLVDAAIFIQDFRCPSRMRSCI